MDKVIDQFCNELEKRYIDGGNAGKVCNLGQWTLFCKCKLIYHVPSPCNH